MFLIRCRLRSYFKNLCFVFHRGLQTLENNKSLFLCLDTPVKHSHSFFFFFLFRNYKLKGKFYVKDKKVYIISSLEKKMEQKKHTQQQRRLKNRLVFDILLDSSFQNATHLETWAQLFKARLS